MMVKDCKRKGRLFNSWRSKIYTQKGKSIGFPDSWKTFEGFCEEMSEGYIEGEDLVLCRKDITKPYSKENCLWVHRGEEQESHKIKFEYNGETKTLVEWANELNVNYTGLVIRYHRHLNDYTPDEIMFGKQISRHLKTPNEKQKIRAKASKMISSYKHKDKIRGQHLCDFDVDWFIDNIMTQPCIYCGDTHLVGADRISNEEGHLKTNVVPCCYTCNCARNDNFTHEEMLILGKTIKEIKLNRKNETNLSEGIEREVRN